MKKYLEFEDLKIVCSRMTEALRSFNPDSIVAIPRGGLVPATLIAKELRLDVSVFYTRTKELHLLDPTVKKIAFVEDLVAQGRTLELIEQTMTEKYPEYEYVFCPVLVDHQYPETKFERYIGFRSEDWIVMPWEDEKKMVEGDRGLFRERSDIYGTN